MPIYVKGPCQDLSEWVLSPVEQFSLVVYSQGELFELYEQFSLGYSTVF